jgi:outer membrane protein assembly factor BamB
MSADLDAFFARARSVADAVEVAPANDLRRRGEVRRRRRTVAVLCTAFALVAATVGVVAVASHGKQQPTPTTTPTARPAPRGFGLDLKGTPVTFGPQSKPIDVDAVIAYDHAYAMWRSADAAPLQVVAIDLTSGAKLWTVAVPGLAERSGLSVAGDVLLVGQGASLTALDRTDGHELWTSDRQTQFVAGDVVISTEGTDLVGRGLHDAKVRWRKPFPNAAAFPMGSDAILPRTGLGLAASTTPRIVVEHADTSAVEVLNAADGSRIGKLAARPAGTHVTFATLGTVYFVSDDDTLLRIDALRDGKATTVYSSATVSRQTRIVACFTGLLCFVESDGTVVALDASTWSVAWRTPVADALDVEPAGNLLLVHTLSKTTAPVPRFAVLDAAGRQLGSLTIGDLVPLRGSQGSVLRPATTGPVGDVDLLALSPDGHVGDLGTLEIGGECSADQLYLICQTAIGFSYWTYRR